METEINPYGIRVLWTAIILWFLWKLAFSCGQHNWWWTDQVALCVFVALAIWDRFEFTSTAKPEGTK